MSHKNEFKNFFIVRMLLLVSTALIPFYFFRFKIFYIPTNIFEIALLLSLMSFLLYQISSFKCLKFGPIWTFVFLAFGAIAVIVSDNTTSALGIFKGWFVLPCIYYLLIINVFNKENIKYLSIPLFISVLTISIWAIMQKMGIISTLFYQQSDSSFGQYLSDHLRVFGPFESPNYLAMFLVPASFLTIPILEIFKKTDQKIILILSYVLPICAIVFSGSRGGIIAAILALLILIISIVWHRSRNSGILISLLAAVFAVAIVAIMKNQLLNVGSDSVRVQIYQYSIQILQNNWLLGIGLGEFYNYISAISIDAISFKTFALPYALHPHSLYLGMALYLGIGGFLSFLAIIIWFFYKIMSMKEHSLSVVAIQSSFVAILTHGLVDTTYYKNDLSALFWLSLALLTVQSYKKIDRVIKK